jgi:hypothetical protein
MPTETTAELPNPPETTPDQFKQEFKENWMNARLAHEGLMLEEVQRRQRATHALAKFAATANVDELVKDLSPSATEDDGVGVSIGNKTYVYTTAQAAQGNTTSTVEASPQVGSSTTNTLGKLAAGAALLGAGGLGTLGAGLAIDYLTRPDPPAVVQPAQPGIDTDTNAGLRFKD